MERIRRTDQGQLSQVCGDNGSECRTDSRLGDRGLLGTAILAEPDILGAVFSEHAPRGNCSEFGSELNSRYFERF